MRTLFLLLQDSGARERLALTLTERENDFALKIRTALSPEAFLLTLRGLIAGTGTPAPPPEPLSASKIPLIEKFDYLLPPGLLLKQFAANMLDREELKRLCIGIG
jgi:hypothetical protein